MAKPQFRDRKEVGQILATRLRDYANCPDVVVVALPRGGVPVAYEISQALQVDLDICLVRKLGVPDHPELAMGAIAAGGIKAMNPEIVASLQIAAEVVLQVVATEQAELERRDRAYRGDRPALDLHKRTVILVDDGIATGATLRVAIAAVRTQAPHWIAIAAPIAAPSGYQLLKTQVDEMVCLAIPDPLYSISQYYQDFSQTSDQEVCDLLARSALAQSTAVSTAEPLEPDAATSDA